MMARRAIAPRPKVPFLHEKQIEREADLLLAEFAERRDPITEPPIPIDDITEILLRLPIELRDLRAEFPFADVHGAMYFRLQKIGIDKSLDPHTDPRRLGRYHFTLAHEVAHWRLHRPYYVDDSGSRSLFEGADDKPEIVCRTSQRKEPVEWQADTFAADLLMPRQMVYDQWRQFADSDREVSIAELRERFSVAITNDMVFFRGRVANSEEEIDIGIKEDYCRPLAERFQVSPEAMRIRLETLKLLVSKKERTLFD